MLYKLNKLEKRILEISFKYKLSHIGSSISSVNIIDKIYSEKKDSDIFILSCGHSFLGLAVVLEKYYKINAENLHKRHGIHPHRNLDDKIYCSTGSLATGICCGIGMAVSNKDKKIYILCSDGETYEGAFWEALTFIDENKIDNIRIFINLNGFAAYKEINKQRLKEKLIAFYPEINIIETNFSNIPFLNGLDAHYKVMTEKEYYSMK